MGNRIGAGMALSLPQSQPTPKPVLNPEESTIFRQALGYFVQKRYDKALDSINELLDSARCANHAESLAMKGLLLKFRGDGDDLAKEYILKGLRYNMKSPTCWEIRGRLHRSDREYNDAINCYKIALRYGPQNIQIFRELSIVQLHTRDLDGYRRTCVQLLKLKPTKPTSWVGLGIAYHLLKDYDMAFEIVEALRKVLSQDGTAISKYQMNELILYQNMILEEKGDIEAAKHHLIKHQREIVDQVTFNVIVARYHLHLGEYSEAEAVYWDLISSEQENRAYFEGLLKSMKVQDGPVRDKLRLFNMLEKRYPKSALIRRLPLELAQEGEFLDRLRPYVTSAVGNEHGAPSLFADLKSLYDNPSKVSQIQDLFLQLKSELEEFGKFSRNDTAAAPADALVWTCCYLASHFAHVGAPQKALQFVEKAIAINDEKHAVATEVLDKYSPVKKHLERYIYAELFEEHSCNEKLLASGAFKQGLMEKFNFCEEGVEEYDKAKKQLEGCTFAKIELLTCKANICKRGGDLNGAIVAMTEARKLDPQDRYLNSKCAKYMLRAGNVEKAINILKKFTTKEFWIDADSNTSEASDVLKKRQCLWFLTECAMAYQKKGKLKEALVKCFEVDKIFHEIFEEQYDFHSYSQSKFNLRSYVKLLRLEDRIQGHLFYFKAAKVAIEINISLHDEELAKIRTAGLTPKKNNEGRKRKYEDSEDNKEARLPNSTRLTPKPLDLALKFLTPLQNFTADKVHTHILAYEVYLRKDKPVLMLKSLKSALRLDPGNKTVQRLYRGFMETMKSKQNSFNEPTLSRFMNDEMEKVCGLFDRVCKI